MKSRIIILFLFALIQVGLFAQEPITALDKTEHTLTLSHESYPEVFESDTVRKIGSFAFNTVTGRAYPFAFQGREHDDEVHLATGTSNVPEYGMNDPRAGRFLSIDPLASKYPFYSPYAFSGNRVIDRVEIEGLEPGCRAIPTWAVLRLLSYTDVNDGVVLATTITRGDEVIDVEGNQASKVDQAFAAGGAFIPFVSGSMIKKLGTSLVEAFQQGGKRTANALGGLVKYSGFGGDILIRSDKTTTVLGKFKNLDDGLDGALGELKRDGKYGTEGLNFLDLPDGTWTWEKNKAFLDEAITRGDAIRLASDPTDLRLTRKWKDGVMTDKLSTFGREIEHLEKQGYKQEGVEMVKSD